MIDVRNQIEPEGAAWIPSPGPPRLLKTPVAVHPLPQGGEGRKLKSAPGSAATLVSSVRVGAFTFALCLLPFAF
jgi:hypothetical protein